MKICHSYSVRRVACTHIASSPNRFRRCVFVSVDLFSLNLVFYLNLVDNMRYLTGSKGSCMHFKREAYHATRRRAQLQRVPS